MKIEDYNFYVNIPYYILNFLYNFCYIIYLNLLKRDFIRDIEIKEDVIPNDYNFYDDFYIFGEVDKKRFYLSCNDNKYRFILDDEIYEDEHIEINKQNLKMNVDEKIQMYLFENKEILEIKFDKEVICLIFDGCVNNKFYKFREGYIQTKKLTLERGLISKNDEVSEIKEIDLYYFKIQGKVKDENKLVELVN